MGAGEARGHGGAGRDMGVLAAAFMKNKALALGEGKPSPVHSNFFSNIHS